MQPMSKTASQLVSEAKQRIENLTPDQLASELERGGVLLVDLREADERAQKGTIPNAVHAPRGMLEFYADPTHEYHLPEFDPDVRLILYCAGGARSALAVEPFGNWATQMSPTSRAASPPGPRPGATWSACKRAPLRVRPLRQGAFRR